jgi:hypothetical protein
MQGDIVKAAKWFGLSIIVSTIILVVGLHITLDKNVRRLGSDIVSAGTNAKPPYAPFPNTITLRHSSAGPFQLDLSPNGKDLRLAPLKIDLKAD